MCPQIHEPGEFADLSSPDYTYLDNLGDTDALLEVMVFLSQYYPDATIERFSARDLPNGHTSGNLVVIGGPGSADDISNELCREMMKSMGSHVSYSSDCEQMIVARQGGQTVELRAEYRTDGQASAPQEPLGVRCDPGYFARFANPLNESATVVLINGVHTTGVLGAAKVFGERREALRNFQAALASGAEPGSFECHFDVQVINRYVKVPEVDPRHIWSLGRAESTVQSMATNAHGHKSASDIRTSATILFIACDRGLNQLQVPNEYDAIQGALHACKHREIISLGNPILAATRGKLAEAYRQRPRIVHFAGHGNKRSLSIIENHGVIANEIPLDADQLCEMLKTMEKRVRLCVLNACESTKLAQRLVQVGAVDYAVGWPAQVPDSVAIAFSRTLYGALGDGRTVADAVNVGIVACGPDHRPVLAAVDSADSTLVVGEEEKR